ncbi:MAG: T9SS type A sorting domain-containing protein, partial [Saprospiraceae bacterium]|nr:T9SS type A sorting domain-containing protein [Saprospiraceae bacterium]
VMGEQYECEEGSNLILVDIWFDSENEGESGFTIRGNGMVYDTFEYGQEFYTVGPIEADCETTYEFIVTDLEHPDCSAFFFFADPPCCEEEACAVEGVIDGAECIDDVYLIDFNLEYEGTNGVGFDVYINDFFHSFQSYENLPIVLEVNKNEFPSPFNITACENDNPDCCSTILFDLNDVSVNEILPADAVQVLLREQQLRMTTELHQPMKAHLIALDGKRLQTRTFNYNGNMDLGGYPSGMYVLFIESELGIYTEKIALIR